MSARNLLAEIVAAKQREVSAKKRKVGLHTLEKQARATPAPRDFAGSLRKVNDYALICEIKKASPSAGVIRSDFVPQDLALAYRKGGAAALSVLTDGPYFHGAPAHLTAARQATTLPVLRKDFIVDPWQVAETRLMHADCLLLILSILPFSKVRELAAMAAELQLSVLLEVHDPREMEAASTIPEALIGINNRNLATLQVDLDVSRELLSLAPPDRLLVSESGLKTRRELERIHMWGAKAFLVGESLLRASDVTTATKALLPSRNGCDHKPTKQ